MKRVSQYNLDYAAALLSAFDISGSLFLTDNLWQSKGRKHDLKQLMSDLDVLEEDYRNACEKITKDKIE